MDIAQIRETEVESVLYSRDSADITLSVTYLYQSQVKIYVVGSIVGADSFKHVRLLSENTAEYQTQSTREAAIRSSSSTAFVVSSNRIQRRIQGRFVGFGRTPLRWCGG